MKVIFDVLHLYYLPQYLPVGDELQSRGIDVQYLFYKGNEAALNRVCEDVIVSHSLKAAWCDSWNGQDAEQANGSRKSAKSFYLDEAPEWIIFGNAVEDLDDIHKVSKTALMQHGIGPKSCYYDVSENPTTVRFIEGQHRLKRLLELYPNSNFVDTGYAKLDPIINQNKVADKTSNSLTRDDTADKAFSLESLGLDINKPTLLYAPTFYPSSIEKFDKNFAEQFADFNIILKPHFFSLTKKKYNKQRKLLEHWAQSKNVYLAKIEDFNLTPFMALADVLVSDASSAIFEFAALEKPVVWCDFYKLRWSYRGVLSFRFKRRLDKDIDFFKHVADKASNYDELLNVVKMALKGSNLCLINKKEIINQLAGKIDGQCSSRIADYLESNQ